MKKQTLLSSITAALLIAFSITQNVCATSINVSGSISSNTTWSGVDTVKVTGNIIIDNAVTLTIDPGILVEFQGHYYIKINGRLLAVGTVSDTITFTVSDTTGYHNYSHTGWNGLMFWAAASNDTSKLVYCKLQYGKAIARGGAILIAAEKFLIDHCDLSHNYSSEDGGAIYIWNSSDAKISNCNIHDNYAVYDGGGIYVWDELTLKNCIINNNEALRSGGGIYLLQTTFTCVNNLISNNSSGTSGGGIYINDTPNTTIFNNTICNNNSSKGGGVYFLRDPSPGFKNTIIYGNTASSSGSQLYFEPGTPTYFHYCDIEGYGGSGTGGSNNGHFINCIDKYPEFVNAGSHPFSIKSVSKCINTGDPSTTTTEAGVHDLAGNSRIYDGFVDRIDIGAYEYQGNPKPAIVSLNPQDDSKILNTNPILCIEFCTLIIAQSGYITIYNNDETVFEQIAANNISLVTIDSNTVQINPVNDFVTDSSYYILIDSLAFSDPDGQKYSGIYDQTSWDFGIIDIYGYPGTALDFDGTDDFVETPLRNLSGSEITIEYWFKGSSTQSAVRQQDGTNYIIAGWDDKHVLSNDGGTSNGIPVGTGAEDGNWHHIAMTWKQNTVNGFVSYLDGQLIASRNSNNTPIPELDANVIFGSKHGTSQFITGSLDEVRIWNVARTETEIRENMYLPLSGIEPGIVSYFQFNEGQGTATHDFISGYIGTLHNMTENDWVSSSIPFGAGAVNSQFVNTTGNVVFINTGLSTDFTAKTGTDTIVAARIDTIPNITPVTVDTVYDSQYWVVNSFGNGTFTANLSFTVAEDLTNDDQNNPSNVRLYGRASASHGDWTLITPANAVDAASNTATFNNISSFGQFILGRHEGPAPPHIIKLTPPDGGITQQNSTLRMIFDQDVWEVTNKSIRFYQACTNTLLETITLPSPQVTGNGSDTITITPLGGLLPGVKYYILIDKGAFKDAFGNDFEGIINPEEWNFSVFTQGHITSDAIWCDSIIVIGNIYVDNGATLEVLPGAVIYFQDHYKLDVKGRILAQGTEHQKIMFTGDSVGFNSWTYTGWDRLQFDGTSSTNDTSKLVHCIFEYGYACSGSGDGDKGGVIYVHSFDKLLISYCIFKNNIACAKGGAMYFYNSDAILANNMIINNVTQEGGGIYCRENSNLTLINNLFYNNMAFDWGGGIAVDWSNPVFLNNTFYDNFTSNGGYGGGIYVYYSNPVFRNTILYGNRIVHTPNQIYLYDNCSDPDFYYCDIEGGKGGFTGNGSGWNYQGAYENNLNTDPQFKGYGEHPYQLQKISPCINTGKPDMSGTGIPPTDLAGNPRIYAGCVSRIDIGAYEFQGDPNLTVQGTIFKSATWGCADTVFITGDVTIFDTAVITIKSGMIVEFQGHYKINVNGRLLAEGAAQDTILFTAKDHTEGWNRIIFENVPAASDTSVFSWCKFEYGFASGTGEDGKGGAVYCNNSNKVLIQNSRFVNNTANDLGGAIYLDNAAITLTVCKLDSNSATNGGGIYISGGDATIRNNLIVANHATTAGGGIGYTNSSATLLNNTICHNTAGEYGGGLYLYQDADPVSRNTIFYYNSATFEGNQVYIANTDCVPDFYYCDVEGGKSAFGGWGAGSNYHGNYEHNIESNPQFTNSGENPYSLQLTSPCWNNGDPGTTPDSVGAIDQAGNPRYVGGRVDIGAYEIQPRHTPDGIPGTALKFDNGSWNYVLGSGIDTNLIAITLEAWVYHDSLPPHVQRYITIGSEVAVIRFGGAVSGGLGELHFYIRKQDGSLVSIREYGVLTTGEWMHVAGTYDGTDMKLYLNGELLKTHTVSAALFHPDGVFTFSHSSETMYGKMDELRVWNNARTAEDIRENMHLTLKGTEPGLMSYWQLNDSTGTTATEIVNGADGTLHNMSNNNWVGSTIPAGEGTSNTQVVSSIGNVNFTSTDVSMDFTAKTGTDAITVTRIDISPNLNPPGDYHIFDSQYWAVNNFGADNFNTNITFRVPDTLVMKDKMFPFAIKLFSRDSNSDSSWTLIDGAFSVNLLDNTATFNDITHFSQFIIGRGDSPGNALVFDGIDDFISIPPDTSLDVLQFTIEYWIKTENPGTQTGVIDKGYGTQSNWYFLTGSVFPRGVTFGLSTSSYTGELIGGWDDNDWHHVAGTYDDYTLTLYLDGTMCESTNIPGMHVTTQDITIGCLRNETQFFAGELDEIRVWNYNRSEDEIREDMHHPLKGTESGLVAYWQFNEYSGLTAHDIAGGNNGTLHNMTDDAWIVSTAPIPYYTISNGNWETNSIWATGQNAPDHAWARARIEKNITINSTFEVIELKVDASGTLTITTGYQMTVSGD